MFKPLVLTLAAFAFSTTLAIGHEFWIDPVDFTLDPGANIQADIRVGQDFAGSPYAFIPQNFRLFELARGDTRVAVTGRVGDRPALNQAPLGDGLNVILHVTRDYDVTWKEWDKFTAFLHHKNADWVAAEHEGTGAPKVGIIEAYSRYGKSLVAVGDGAGADRRYGLLTEIVALANPYTDDLSQGLPLQIFYDDKPRATAQIEVFAKTAEGSVAVNTYRTNAEGIATIPVEPGMTYLFDSVVLRRPAGDQIIKDAQWESLWASLTVKIPG